jgi:hypothetical protein
MASMSMDADSERKEMLSMPPPLEQDDPKSKAARVKRVNAKWKLRVFNC